MQANEYVKVNAWNSLHRSFSPGRNPGESSRPWGRQLWPMVSTFEYSSQDEPPCQIFRSNGDDRYTGTTNVVGNKPEGNVSMTPMMILNFCNKSWQVGVISVTFVEKRPGQVLETFHWRSARACSALKMTSNQLLSPAACACAVTLARVGASTSNSRPPAAFSHAPTVAAGRFPTVHSLANTADDPPAITPYMTR